MLEDGNYDVFIVDASDDEHARDVVHVTLTVMSGARKSEVVTLRAQRLERDSIELIGLPGTLVVRDGRPHLTVDD